MRSRVRNYLTILVLVVLVLTGCAAPWESAPQQEGVFSAATATAVALSSESTEVESQASSRAVDAASPVPPTSSAVEIVKRVSPAVVTVVNEQQLGGLGSDRALEAGRGTGFIIDEVGHIVTNWHVVNGGDKFEVIFANGEKRPVTLEGADRLSDLAVVRVDGALPAIVPFGNSDTLAPGLPVLAIGSPLGTFTNTVTDGIISGLGGTCQDHRSWGAYVQQFDSA